jgi:hypothetical protein
MRDTERLSGTEFDAIVSAQQRTPGLAVHAARLVLVNGETVRGAARVFGISNTAVTDAVNRILRRHHSRQQSGGNDGELAVQGGAA